MTQVNRRKLEKKSDCKSEELFFFRMCIINFDIDLVNEFTQKETLMKIMFINIFYFRYARRQTKILTKKLLSWFVPDVRFQTSC